MIILIPLNKAFIKATQYTTKSGKVVNRKAYTDKRVAKVHMPSNRVRAAWRSSETHAQVSERLHKKHSQLLDDAKEVLKHHDAIKAAKGKGDTHSEHGIHTDDHHHVLKQIKNIHSKLEDSSQRIMLHQSHTSLLDDKKKPQKKSKEEILKQKKNADWKKFIESRKKIDEEKTKKEWDEDDKRETDKKKTLKSKADKPQKKDTRESVLANAKKRGFLTMGDQIKLDKIKEEETEEETEEGVRSKIKERGYATLGDSEKLEKIFDQRKKNIDNWRPTEGKNALVFMNGMHITHPHKNNEYARMPMDDALKKATYLSKYDIFYQYLPRPSVYKKGTYDIARVPKSEIERIKFAKSRKE